jgi:tyrosinase
LLRETQPTAKPRPQAFPIIIFAGFAPIAAAIFRIHSEASRRPTMMNRRSFVAGAATTLAAPFVVTRIREARAATPRLRRDVQGLDPSDPFFSKYADAVQKMHDLPSTDPRNWRNQALIHINLCPHGSQTFVHWHRHYILNFELICGTLIGDPTFALSYWNWSAKNGIIPDPFFDVDRLNVQFFNDPSNAQSDNWSPDPVNTIGTRGLSKGQGLQDDPNAGVNFTQDTIDGIKQATQFPVFTGQLEGMPHNSGHVVSGGANGHMSSGMSPLDPIFWLHHCNVDRIWAEWETAGNTTPGFNVDYSNQFVDGAGQPATASSASALDFAAMNYTYDTLSGPLVAQQINQLGLSAVRPSAARPPAAAAPQVLGTATTPVTVKPSTQASFTVSAKELSTSLFRERTFMATKAPTLQRLATGTGRIIAKLSEVMPPPGATTPLICKVFVNSAYLEPTTPSHDPLCAGSFSFFGSHGAAHGHQEFYVDISGPLHVLFRQGAIDPEQVKIQLMAVPVQGAPAGADLSFTVGKVELLST